MVTTLRFYRYGLIGVGNTLLHWAVFFLLHQAAGLSQASSNLLAFAVAVSASYYLNARFTFATAPSKLRYLAFVSGMGCLSLSMGALSDRAGLSPWLTLVAFSAVSLIIGYGYSRTVVFKRRQP
ncbi:translocase [Pseudomonas sp. SG-MS2]|uniref:GtrA family protein n=1 Tax=Pseudomonas sp. SG-MS2 TaxID=1914534 RepID=UPI00137AC87D|nr:GtrA family protein [Pseudomonas sp. SG-MS2]KAF1312514.1 translocase [Pseudomonas sp. SG-MS2]